MMPIERLFDISDSTTYPEELYASLTFPDPPEGRPYVYVNMVSTVDGKILIGPRGSTAKGVGGPTDQLLLRRLEENADCAIIGAGTLRPGNVIYPSKLQRAVVTRSGDLPFSNRFFTDTPGRAIVFGPENIPAAARARILENALFRAAGLDAVDAAIAVRILREEFGVRSLLLEGGADLNSSFFLSGLVDELFITIAPKIKGGEQLPTPVEGPGFPDRTFASMILQSVYQDDSELYLRYKVGRTESA